MRLDLRGSRTRGNVLKRERKEKELGYERPKRIAYCFPFWYSSLTFELNFVLCYSRFLSDVSVILITNNEGMHVKSYSNALRKAS